ncbi:amino acid oxidase [Kribbella sp. ALI-6-A]|uniref:FAD-dependent oxidoreductase n=1 Tax=Kribbella sp. ALI-6-A TaxID=1933817 RepID=UPI00097BC5E3|nr:FAD-dependent oxidoreductase [Kribbella sp. ALI-6-A]ONI76514.1 amino acid oxidase [Kribbella sp. ALI-6-A]
MRVVVLGAGISGLSTALVLRERGEDVVVVSADATEATTSHLAAAIWFPTSAGPADKVAAWGSTTYDVLAAEAERGMPGVVMRESLVVYRDEPGPQPWTDAVGEVRAARPDELPAGYSHGLRFAVPLVEMPTYLPRLHQRYLDTGGQHVVRRVAALTDLLDLAPDVIVNCAGLAAGRLVGDSTTYPIRGQIVRVRNPGLTLSVRDEHHPGGRAYVHPRTDDCILGGTLDQGVWDTTVDDATTAAIVARCADLVPALADAEVIEALVGLRPGRPEVRLERDEQLVPGVPVVHNYGHGGSGITLGWGCAQEAAALV